jgi:hypothetical protein
MLAMLASVIQFWDLRVILVFLGIALGQYALARLTWRETRRAWLVLGFLITFMTVLTFLTGRGGVGTAYTQEHVLTRLGPLTLPLVGVADRSGHHRREDGLRRQPDGAYVRHLRVGHHHPLHGGPQPVWGDLPGARAAG